MPGCASTCCTFFVPARWYATEGHFTALDLRIHDDARVFRERRSGRSAAPLSPRPTAQREAPRPTRSELGSRAGCSRHESRQHRHCGRRCGRRERVREQHGPSLLCARSHGERLGGGVDDGVGVDLRQRAPQGPNLVAAAAAVSHPSLPTASAAAPVPQRVLKEALVCGVALASLHDHEHNGAARVA
jgi:hypothetical protein